MPLDCLRHLALIDNINIKHRDFRAIGTINPETDAVAVGILGPRGKFGAAIGAELEIAADQRSLASLVDVHRKGRSGLAASTGTADCDKSRASLEFAHPLCGTRRCGFRSLGDLGVTLGNFRLSVFEKFGFDVSVSALCHPDTSRKLAFVFEIFSGFVLESDAVVRQPLRWN